MADRRDAPFDSGSSAALAGYRGPRLFGAPVGDFSAFQTVLLSLAVGALSFFLGTFLGILGVTILSAVTHHPADFTASYKWVGLPLGIGMFVVASLYLGSLLIRRMTRG